MQRSGSPRRATRPARVVPFERQKKAAAAVEEILGLAGFYMRVLQTAAAYRIHQQFAEVGGSLPAV